MVCFCSRSDTDNISSGEDYGVADLCVDRCFFKGNCSQGAERINRTDSIFGHVFTLFLKDLLGIYICV